MEEAMVILVDENDIEVGVSPKMAAHIKSLCHRAFSVFIMRTHEGEREILLQKRKKDKYHCGGLWTNTCCSHPAPGEEVIAAGERRLFEEMGIKAALRHTGKFHYIAHFENGLTENEVDHVLLGEYDGKISINLDEVEDYRWMTVKALKQDLHDFPAKYTPWFKEALEVVQPALPL